MLSELRHTLRALARTPSFAVFAVLVVAVGLGAGAAIFSVVRAVLLRPLPFQNAGRLHRVLEAHTPERRTDGWIGLSVATYDTWRRETSLFSHSGATVPASVTLSGEGEPRMLRAAQITADFFPMLGVAPVLGRGFTAEEDAAGAPVAIIGERLWRSQFGGAAEALGRSVTLDGQPRTVIGVMPPGLRFQGDVDLWLPLGALARPGSVRGGSFLWVGVRLRDGVTASQVEARLAELARQSPVVNANNLRIWHARLIPLRDELAAPVRGGVLALAGAAAALLLVAGANFSALLLARTLARMPEAALRLALGASRWQIARQAIAPAAVLAAGGAALGLGLAALLMEPLVAASPLSDGFGAQYREVGSEVQIDASVVAAALGGAALLGLGFGGLSAWLAVRHLGGGTLRLSLRTSTMPGATRRWLRLLVAGEIAVTVGLLAAAVLLARVFRERLAEPWGFAPDGAVTFNVSFPVQRYAEHAPRIRLAEEALRRLRETPGVTDAAGATTHPLFATLNQAMFSAEGVAPPAGQDFRVTYHTLVTPGFFSAMRTPLQRGRDFTAGDTANSPLVVIVSQALAARLWPGEDPIGKRVKRGRADSDRPWLTVVGVAADVKSQLDPNRPSDAGKWYLPFAQHHRFLSDQLTFVVRSPLAPAGLEVAVRRAFLGVDPQIAVHSFAALETQAGRMHAGERFNSLVVVLFGAAGLVLAAGGLYGLLSFHVAQRTRELGIRAAFGAEGRDIFRLVLREGAVLWAVGFVGGVVLVAAAGRLLPLPAGAPPLADPAMLAVVGVVLAGAAFVACWAPARRAARIDPIIALRAE